MNGIKKIEVRKESVGKAVQKLIDEQGYADIYVYCSKGKEKLCYSMDMEETPTENQNWKQIHFNRRYYISDRKLNLNGKVVFKFRCYNVEEILVKSNGNYYTNTLSRNKLLSQSCLSQKEILEYAGSHISKISSCWFCGYAIHISDLEIFDKPKELNEFNHWTDKKIQWYSVGEKVKVMVSLTNAPQNYCYVEIGK